MINLKNEQLIFLLEKLSSVLWLDFLLSLCDFCQSAALQVIRLTLPPTYQFWKLISDLRRWEETKQGWGRKHF